MNKTALVTLLIIGLVAAGAGLYSLGKNAGLSGSITGMQVKEEQKNEDNNLPKVTTIEPANLINQIILLRKASNEKNIVETASLVSDINKEVQATGNPSLNSDWGTVAGCVYDNCIDDKYISMIKSATLDSGNANLVIINQAITTYNLWNGKNLIQFSDALSTTDKSIQGLGDNVKAKWKEIIECNGQCADFSGLVIGLIDEIV
jgi:hypothetical protein